ncbi:MAG: protease inhibitor I42 family protein [Desulfomonilaceae bacterium]
MNFMGEMYRRSSYTLMLLMLCPLLILVPATSCRSQVGEKSVKVNKEFKISLDSNPTTGYKWEASFDKAFVQLKADRFKRPAKALIGAGGIQTFVFLPVKQGETSIRFVYKRHWEKSIAREKTFRIHISR